MDNKRRTIDLLPVYLRTETLRKVFAATVDHLFQPESVEFLTGYVGIKPPWNKPSRDFYLAEPNKDRQDYQLTSTIVSRDFQSGQLTNALFYDDLINQLRFQGALVNNHSRLFDEEYYSWSPPIDLDKFVNFSKYYWLPAGPDPIELLETTDLENEAAGQRQFTYTGWVKYTSTGEITQTVLTFTSGTSIIPRADKTLTLNDQTIFIEGVGRSIYLYKIPPLENPGWDRTTWDMSRWDTTLDYIDRQYATISRTSVDQNQWSTTNRWFHIDVINQAKMFLVDQTIQQARRPIIEFQGNIELYRYGTNSRGILDIVDTDNGDLLGSIVGQPSWSIDTVPLQNGMRIMGISPSLAQLHPSEYGRIYVVSGVDAGNIQLTLDVYGTNGDGAPRFGDRTISLFGQLQNLNLWYDGTRWTTSGQQKFGVNPPLFALYDYLGISMNNPVVYPGSSFTGSKVFSYTTDVNSAMDAELGINPKLDQFGDYVFTNDLINEDITYISDAKSTSYNGYLFAKISTEYANSWNLAPQPSRQYIVNNFVSDGRIGVFIIDQTPAVQIENTLPTIYVIVIAEDGTTTELKQNIDYSVSQNIVTLFSVPDAGTRVQIRSWSNTTPNNLTGYYEIPKNLSANPNNEDIQYVSRSQFLQQFVEIINNQSNLIGDALGSNNYRDTLQNLGLGVSILQHRAPMLKLGVMNSTQLQDVTTAASKTDPMLAMQNAQRSYQRFYNRFLQALFSQARQLGGNTSPSGCDPTFINQMVALALKQINVGKTPESPWANSGPSGLPGSYCSIEAEFPSYVPATAARLGITPAFHPVVYFDTSYTQPQLVIQCHDGSRIVMVNEQGEQLGTFVHGQSSTTNPEELTNSVAAAWLKFELDLYDNLPAAYKNPQAKYVFDIRTYMPGKWRYSDYSRQDVIQLTRAAFDKWAVSNQVEYKANTGYDTTNQFSYNYRSVTDRQGQPVPGHWQGIYRWFYDTDRPHSHPWEMLGFSQLPDWWEDEYGPSPYTNGNTALWSDLSLGLIRRGPRAGINQAWARPGLLECIPVDNQGNLLPPYQAGCVISIPDVYAAQSEWEYGDGSPVETALVNSQEYPFILAQTGYLMKPARFVEYTWDILRTEQIYADTNNSQWIYIDTNSRRASNEFYVHREKPRTLSTGVVIPNESDLAYFGSCGFQHWVSEYLISQGLAVTQYFGNIIRGGGVQLAHRMAGFINADSLRTMVDSFGDIGYQSQIIPNDNVDVYLYRSTSIGEAVYSGVLIQQVRDGWKIYGYDTVGQTFTIIPSDTNGPKHNVTIGNQRATEYLKGVNKTQTINYGVVMPTRQAVYDFLISYGRWLESQGWIFDQFSSDANVVLNWNQSAKEFLFWSQGGWQNGTFITLSPSAAEIKYAQPYGNIQYVNGIVAGAYPIVDRAGRPIQPQNITTIRDEGSLTVRPDNTQGVFLLRLYRTTLEHAVFWDNITNFNDIIYQPLYDLRQSRIKIYAYRANDWNGRVDAPGFILTQNQTTGTWSMVPNYDSTSLEFTKYYNIEQPKNFTEISNTGLPQTKTTELGAVSRVDIQNLARHLLGYQNRLYLQNLLLEDATEFEFYQGFIRNKGTKNTIDRLLRNTAIIPEASTFEYYEEWLLRTGYYGAVNLNNLIEYRIPQNRVNSDPQWVRLFSTNDSDQNGDDVIDIVPNDPLIVTPPESYQDKLFSLRKTFAVDPATDLPLAGYVQLGETTWLVTNTTELLAFYNVRQNTATPLKVGDTIWQFITDSGSWQTWILAKSYGDVLSTLPSATTGGPTVITTTVEHGLIDGDIVIIYGVTGVNLLNGTYVISNVTPFTFQIPISTFEPGRDGTIWVYRPTRFANVFDRDSGEPPGGWPQGVLTYVDDGGIVPGAWTVYRYLNTSWLPYRQQEYKIDSSLLLKSVLYDSKSRKELAVVTYFDPAQGRISGKADIEITYKTDFDPAKYNRGNNTGFALNESEAWGSAQVGQVWWDLSTVRYIDYEQGDDRYRIQHWGKIAPGTSVDVYEWIRTTIPPTDWTFAVTTGESVTENGRSYIPSGSVKNPQNPSWTQTTEYGPGNVATIYYYYWVKNSSMPPASTDRILTTLNISNLIQNPSIDGSPWYAAISERSIIIGNIAQLLNGDQVIQSIEYTSTPNNANDYSQWELIRDGDPTSPISQLVWTKLKDSLVTFDGMNNDVPDYKLPSIQRYGTTIRPRQTWFEDRVAASQLFVNTFNSLLASSTTPMVDNPSMMGWQTYFTASEPTPPQEGNWDYQVENLAERDGLIGAILPGQVVLVDPTSITNNLWTMWQYQPSESPWLLVRQQSYNTNNFWQYVDWYLTGYNAETQINTVVETDADLRDITNPTTGTVVKVLNNGNNKWQLYTWITKWILVGQQDGNIQVLSSIYDWAVTPGGFDSVAFSVVAYDKNAATEFANVIDGIKNAIYSEPNSIELNQLFFAMINYVPSEQTQVDWLVKTSDIVLKGFNQPLTTSQLLQVDTIDSIIGFLNEAKPYHVKIREFINGKSATDLANVSVVDFDRPPGSPFNAPVPAEGTAERSYYDTYQSWNNNYLTNPELVRTLTTTLIFDRISTPALGPAWGYIWDVHGWQDAVGENFGAIDRINEFYSPTSGMIPKVIEDLMTGVAYQGTRLIALGFNVDVGWDRGEWSMLGWDANAASIEAYLDQIIQGGMIPIYDSAIGNGTTTQFPLIREATNPNELVVWSDGSLRMYGVDWYVPTYAVAASIIDGGLGYSIGDQLDLIAGNKIAAARIKVTQVSGGTITGIEIIGKGSYITVLPGPYQLEYPTLYPGVGYGGLISVDWACKNITFMSAPTSSAVPNIYVLYIGTTFGAAPTNDADSIYDGYDFVQPNVDENHPEEFYSARVRDSLMLDTISQPAGGRPMVSSRVYITDGIKDQFELLISPQNNSAVTAYLAGNLLTEGFANDYVLNFETNRLVFVTTPSAGQILQIFTISTGGASRQAFSAHTVSPGIDYQPNDLIILDNSIGVLPSTLAVTSVQAVQVNIISGGVGYNINDLLVLDQNTGSVKDGNITTLRVTAVNLNGTILSASIENAGEWLTLPSAYVWNLNGQLGANFIAADISLSWGVRDTAVVGEGLYARIPQQPLSQSFSSTGTGATFNIGFTSKLNEFRYVGDGVSTDFAVPGTTLTQPAGIFVTVDGVVTPILSRLLNAIRLPAAPGFGAIIIITTFSSSEYSLVFDTVFSVTNPAILTYAITQPPSSTLPSYLSTMVKINGNLVEPPLMQQFLGDGVTTSFTISVDLTGAIATDVYVDQILQTGYTITGGNLILATAPALNADIQLVCIKSNTNYVISGTTITFASGVISLGDQVMVTTYTQDLDYEFHTEEYNYSASGIYNLTKVPYDPTTIQVWVDGILQTPMKDYNWILNNTPPTLNDYSSATTCAVSFDPLTHTGTNIVITYMVGLPERPSIAWRTITTDVDTRTVCLDSARQTELLSNVYTYSASIEIADFNKISAPSNGEPSYVFIGDELISFAEIHLAPSVSYPNRAFLVGLQRNRFGTSGNPRSSYNIQWYNGDGSNTYFATEAAGQALGETVYVDGEIQINQAVQSQNADYEFVINPPALPAGRYVHFLNSAPPYGYKNVQIASLNVDLTSNNLTHAIPNLVKDAGSHVKPPTPYFWQPTPYGFQYNKTTQAQFYISHPYTG